MISPLTNREKDLVVKNALAAEANKLTVTIRDLEIQKKRAQLKLSHLREVLKKMSTKPKQRKAKKNGSLT